VDSTRGRYRRGAFIDHPRLIGMGPKTLNWLTAPGYPRLRLLLRREGMLVNRKALPALVRKRGGHMLSSHLLVDTISSAMSLRIQCGGQAAISNEQWL